MNERFWSFYGLPRYLTAHGQELAFVSFTGTGPAPGTYAVILGIKHPHKFRSVDEAMAYIETYIALK